MYSSWVLGNLRFLGFLSGGFCDLVGLRLLCGWWLRISWLVVLDLRVVSFLGFGVGLWFLGFLGVWGVGVRLPAGFECVGWYDILFALLEGLGCLVCAVGFLACMVCGSGLLDLAV